MEKIITSDDILGKEAIDPEGEYLGIVMKLHIDREKKILLGITVDQGFMKPDLYVGLDYIERFGIDAVLINKIPMEKYIGLRVYDASGGYCGVIQELEERDGRLEKICVRVKLAEGGKRQSAEKSLIKIPIRDIAEIGYSILLKKSNYLEFSSVPELEER